MIFGAPFVPEKASPFVLVIGYYPRHMVQSAPSHPGRVPPHDLRAEAAVLGAILLDNDALNRIVSTSKPDDFYRENHREIFRAMVELANDHKPIDTVTLSKHLRDNDKLKAAGGGAYLIQLSAETPAAVNVEHYAKIVRDKAVIRSVIDAARVMVDEGFNDPGDCCNLQAS